MMPGLILWKNQEINKLRKDIDRLFDRVLDEFSMPPIPRPSREVPFIDVSETKKDLIVTVEVPGINPEDLDISLIEDRLTIKGDMKQEIVNEGEGYHRTERRYGSFSRTLRLPCRVLEKDIQATYKKGILNIVLPKCKPEKAPRIKIRVK
jgi:HSP20 family protein